MMGNLWWLWIVLAFLLSAFLIWLVGRRNSAPPARMAHPVPPEGVETPTAAIRTDVIAPASDDLEIIEGIGPKIAVLLRQAGIATFAELAVSDLARLEQILTAANLSRLTDPVTWPKQAALAAEGRWEELAAYQQTLKGGRVH